MTADSPAPSPPSPSVQPPVVVIQPTHGLASLQLAALWHYRDVNYLAPFLVQTWMYLTPVVYGATLLPEQLRWLLALNPMALVVEGFRCSICIRSDALTCSRIWWIT
jgi:ABC-type polysaccharide/polyol phosphate export permease